MKSGNFRCNIESGSEDSSTLSTVGHASGNECCRLKVRSQEFISGYHSQGGHCLSVVDLAASSVAGGGRRADKGRGCHDKERGNDNGTVV